MVATETLSSVDAAWLHMEDPTNLMMVTGVLLFDEPIDFGRFRSLMETRLLRHPRFRQRVVEPRLPIGMPHWEEDTHFDLGAHVRRVALPAPGDDATLQELVSDLMATPLDFSKPLWQFHLVEGYGRGCAVLGRLHHAIADGIALINVLLSLTDEAEEARAPGGDPVSPSEAPASVWSRLSTLPGELLGPAIGSLTSAFLEGDDGAGKRRPPESTLSVLLAPAAEAVERALDRTGAVLHEGFETLVHPERLLALVERGVCGVDALGKLLVMTPDPKTAFKGPLGVSKRAVWSEPFALDDVKAVGKVIGGTVNDVLLTAAAGALRRYLVGRGEIVLDLEVRAVVPVNLRRAGSEAELGNRFGLVFLALPLSIEDPVERLYELRQRMDDLKGSPEALVAFGLLGAIGRTPAEVEHAVVNLFGSRGTGVMTNVPGPREPITFAGRRMSRMMFWVPQSGRLGLGLSILSYAGSVMIGVATDTGLVPDPQRIVDGFRAEFESLFALVRHEWEAGQVEARV